jgi:hypothetical protein
MEVPNWDTDTEEKFLLHLLKTDIGINLEEDEASSARQLSDTLCGHAMAISIMAQPSDKDH